MEPVRFMTTSSALPSPRLGLDDLQALVADGAGVLASSVDCSLTRDAVPPMWNVRIVSCVPGSPIDCAAMTPTARPSSTSLPVARSRP